MKRLLVVGIASAATVLAQPYTISTFAGGVPAPTAALALTIGIGRPQGIATDVSGNVYFTGQHVVFKLAPNGVLTRVAGNARPGYSGDGGPATSAKLNIREQYGGLAVDSSGAIYIADSGNNRVRKVSPDGIISTIAGNGANMRVLGDGGPALSSTLAGPCGLALDKTGALYIADAANNRIRKISPGGVITTFAGGGAASDQIGDLGPAASAVLSGPQGVALDSGGNVYIADPGHFRVRKVSTNGMISTVVGGGGSNTAIATGLTHLNFSWPVGLAVDPLGNLYVSDQSFSRVLKVFPNGSFSVAAGFSFSGYGSAVPDENLRDPGGIVLDTGGNLYIADTGSHKIKRLSGNQLAVVAGNGLGNNSGDGGQATHAQLDGASGVAVDANGALYIADSRNRQIRKVTPDGVITTVAGNGLLGYYDEGDGGPAANAPLTSPVGVAVDGAGVLYIVDKEDGSVRKVTPDGIIKKIAGNQSTAALGDGGPALRATLMYPSAVAVDRAGAIYIADSGNDRIRKIDLNGIITTVAGQGSYLYRPPDKPPFGDGGQATNASLATPSGLALDSAGNLYIADTIHSVVRLVFPNGIITTFAGDYVSGQSGDGGLATNARLNPYGVTADPAGNVYIADGGNREIRKVSTDGRITRIAGTGDMGDLGENGPADQAQFFSPNAIAVDTTGKIYVADDVMVRLLQPPPPPVPITAVTNAASNVLGAVAPGEVVTLSGSGMGPAEPVKAQPDGSGMVSTQLAGTGVLFNGVPGQILYTSATSVSAIVPDTVSGQGVQVVAVYHGATTNPPFSAPLTLAAPGLFTADSSGRGQAAAINQDGSSNSPDNPAATGSTVSLYATGLGLSSSGLALALTIGGQPAAVINVGTPTLGVTQIDVQIPDGLTVNTPEVVIQVGSFVGQSGVTLGVSQN